MKEFLEIGKIVNVHGIKGEVKIMPYCDEPELICEFESLLMGKDRKEIDIIQARVQKNMVVAKIKGIDTVEDAVKLREKMLYIHRDDLELEEGVYYIQDLIGLTVIDVDNNTVYGEIDDVFQTGANDVYQINSGDKKLLIPAIPDVVMETDLENKKMLIRPLEGLFDED